MLRCRSDSYTARPAPQPSFLKQNTLPARLCFRELALNPRQLDVLVKMEAEHGGRMLHLVTQFLQLLARPVALNLADQGVFW
jgi:hypothetical protein